MKLLKTLLIGVLAILLVPGAALAAPSQEGILYEVGAGYFDVWKHTNGTWQDNDNKPGPDKPGQRKTILTTVTCPQFFKEKYKLTRVEVKLFPTESQYNKSPRAQWQPWEDFKEGILQYLPADLTESSIKKSSEDLSRGIVTIQHTFTLSPKTLDLKSPAIRNFLNMSEKEFNDMAEGWRWYYPFTVIWYGVPDAAPDLYVKTLDPGTDEVKQGKRYNGSVTFGLKPDYPKPVRAKLILTHNGYPVYPINGQIITFQPGEEKSFNFSFTGQDSDSRIEAKIKPVDISDDSNWENNTKWVEIPMFREPQPVSGSLTFQAVSQDRSITRPVNTAKWTDWVTATLKPSAPEPPRGTLDWWKITSARLTYPKKNPNFTFGTPYGPIGTRTINMNAHGHTATVEFQEDWAMDGAKIYSILEKKMMAEKPKYYTITAEYTIKYQYSWIECDEDGCWTETRVATTSGVATGQLLVNGTGVDSRAQ